MQKVEVTYENNGRVIVETCELPDYNAAFFTFDGVQLPEDISEAMKKDGFVMFEDDEGLFCLHISQIKNIRQI